MKRYLTALAMLLCAGCEVYDGLELDAGAQSLGCGNGADMGSLRRPTVLNGKRLNGLCAKRSGPVQPVQSSNRAYLMMGQSNLEGARVRAANLTGQYIGMDATLPDVNFTAKMRCGNATDLEDALATDCDLEIPWGPLEVISPTVHRWFGPEMALGRQLYNASGPGDEISIVKVSTGGTSLSTHWNPDATTGRFKYQRALQFYNQRVAELPELPELGAVVWIQGYADGQNTSTANAYAANLAALIPRVRADFAGGAQVPFIVVRLSDIQTNPNLATIQAAQDAAAAIPGVRVVNTDDLSLIPGDPAHFDANTMMEIGIRVHTAILEVEAE